MSSAGVVFAVVVLALLGLAMSCSILALRALAQRREAVSRQGYRIEFPRDLQAAAVLGFVRSLGGLLRPWWRRPFGLVAVVFELRADERGVFHRLLVPRGQEGYVVGQLRAAIPAARVSGLAGSSTFVGSRQKTA